MGQLCRIIGGHQNGFMSSMKQSHNCCHLEIVRLRQSLLGFENAIVTIDNNTGWAHVDLWCVLAVVFIGQCCHGVPLPFTRQVWRTVTPRAAGLPTMRKHFKIKSVGIPMYSLKLNDEQDGMAPSVQSIALKESIAVDVHIMLSAKCRQGPPKHADDWWQTFRSYGCSSSVIGLW